MDEKVKKVEKVPDNTVTRDIIELSQTTGNIYESTVIIAKRANQIAAELKKELSDKLEEFSNNNMADTLEETFENREQIEISRHYEKLPKPTLTAIKEFQNGEIYWRKIES
ncbi:MAG: DNA-directed RNA polymerase subunit omega [Bacteroidales bacterium]|jgi:DNA-directed RNA polymerase subunit K/omega|nr:DNA-directed RNA polymerase subunit omega [Bacteroidales bacterium]MCI1733907.1 DNA-directed RNA polymerase subunit omega [Bacteroidales bacterium]MDD2241723.1 DNA-directed RNA polymerase subunit omega [Bacteroidales bacterium]MDD3911588.1 DNA-directed RNA polymerase subunit omega [Bacteroidales bacterium]MDD4420102.1 DNA-directed RNA polymerase subunit omega [Bacteroidales bacterium]